MSLVHPVSTKRCSGSLIRSGLLVDLQIDQETSRSCSREERLQSVPQPGGFAALVPATAPRSRRSDPHASSGGTRARGPRLTAFGLLGLWEHEPMSLVTLSATYGAGGSEVGPELAKRLGVPFVDRLIPSEVAARLAVSRASAFANDGVSGGVLARTLATLAPIGQAFGETPATEPVDDRDFREVTEQVIFERAESGHGVIRPRRSGGAAR